MSRHWHLWLVMASSALILIGLAARLQAQTDAYERYVKTSKDFRRVNQNKDFALKAWPG